MSISFIIDAFEHAFTDTNIEWNHHRPLLLCQVAKSNSAQLYTQVLQLQCLYYGENTLRLMSEWLTNAHYTVMTTVFVCTMIDDEDVYHYNRWCSIKLFINQHSKVTWYATTATQPYNYIQSSLIDTMCSTMYILSSSLSSRDYSTITIAHSNILIHDCCRLNPCSGVVDAMPKPYSRCHKPVHSAADYCYQWFHA